ncbi:MAG TPA: hypothetical protein VKZ65_00230 [Glycomyces sp.]|nr:hypothetical protein [Glycomyces sp.]
MIRTVADRIASSTRPAYKGRHRRGRAGSAASGPRRAPARETAEIRREEDSALPAPCA